MKINNRRLKIEKSDNIEKPSGAIAIAGNMDLKERKFYDVFLKVAKDTLIGNSSEDWFSVSLQELKNFLGIERDNNNKAIKGIIHKLHKIDVEYNILGKDKEIEGYSSLLSDVEFVKNKETYSTVVKFSIPKRVRLSMIDKNGMYASINLVIVKGLRSKYSLILYELAKDYKNVEIPMMTMEEFRKVFGLYQEKKGRDGKVKIEKKYSKMPNLRQRVLDNACNEISNNSKIKFSVAYKLYKTGKEYTHIKFLIKSKKTKKILRQLGHKGAEIPGREAKTVEINVIKAATAAAETEMINQFPELANLANVSKQQIEQLLSEYSEKSKEYIRAQIRYVLARNPKSFVSYLQNALEGNYAQAGNETGNNKINEEISRLNEKYKDQYLYINNKSMKFEYISGKNGMLKLFAYDKENSILCRFNLGKDLKELENKLSKIERKTKEEGGKRKKMLQEGMVSEE